MRNLATLAWKAGPWPLGNFPRSGVRAAGPARQIKNRLMYKDGRRKATADRDRPFLGAVESPSRSVVHGVSR